MKAKSIVLPFVVLTCLVLSCKKDPVVSAEVTKLTLTDPVEGTRYAANEVVRIKASAIHNHEMHGYTVWIHSKNGSSDTTFFFKGHEHGATFNIDTSWLNTSPADTLQVVDVTVYLDHHGNTRNEKRNIICK